MTFEVRLRPEAELDLADAMKSNSRNWDTTFLARLFRFYLVSWVSRCAV